MQSEAESVVALGEVTHRCIRPALLGSALTVRRTQPADMTLTVSIVIALSSSSRWNLADGVQALCQTKNVSCESVDTWFKEYNNITEPRTLQWPRPQARTHAKYVYVFCMPVSWHILVCQVYMEGLLKLKRPDIQGGVIIEVCWFLSEYMVTNPLLRLTVNGYKCIQLGLGH